MDNNEDYKNQLKTHLKDVEGFSEKIYKDSKGNDTIGYGFNLDAPDVAGYMQMNGYDRERLDREGLPVEAADQLKDFVIGKEEDKLKKRLPDVYDNLPSNEKAAVMSLFYNSPNLIGPDMTGYLANGDKLNAAKEILTKSNKNKDIGTGFRRMKEAEMFSGADQIENVFKILSPEERVELQKMVESSDNENVKRDVINRYGKYLNPPSRSPAFTKLK